GLAGNPAEGARSAGRAARARVDLGPERGAEAVGQDLDDLLAERGRVLVGQRPLGGLEGDPERDRLTAFADLGAAVDVEGPELAQLGTGRLMGGAGQLSGRDPLGDGEGEVLTEGWKRDHVLVDEPLRHAREQGREVELEHPPGTFE